METEFISSELYKDIIGTIIVFMVLALSYLGFKDFK